MFLRRRTARVLLVLMLVAALAACTSESRGATDPGAGLPAIEPGTARFHARVEIDGGTYDVLGIDVERDTPRLRLRDDRLVEASRLAAAGLPPCPIGGTGKVAFQRPGSNPVEGELDAGTKVTVVVRWQTGLGGPTVQALVRWEADGGWAFGIVPDASLACLP